MKNTGETVTAAIALVRMSNVAEEAADLLQASAPHAADRFRAHAMDARAGHVHLSRLIALLKRAAESLDEYHQDGENTQGPSPLADEIRAALTPPPLWVTEPIPHARRAGGAGR